MEIPPLPPLPPIPGSAAPIGLKPGQVLEGLVKAVDPEGTVRLLIQGREITVRPQMQLTAGQQLLLKSAGTAQMPELRLLQSPPPPNPVLEAIRHNLPRQQPLPLILHRLTTLAREADSGRQLPPATQRALQQLTHHLTPMHNLMRSAGVQQAVRQSGLFTESYLRQSAQQLHSEPAPQLGHKPPIQPVKQVAIDLKSLLLRLVAQITQKSSGQLAPSSTNLAPRSSAQPAGAAQSHLMPAGAQLRPTGGTPMLANLLLELLTQSEAGLSRIRLHQLESQPAPEGSRQRWHLEIPLAPQQSDAPPRALELRIERDERNAAEATEQSWSVVLATELEQLGPIAARITLRGEQLTTLLYADLDETVARFEQELDSLRANLERAGLEVSELRCCQGRPLQPLADWAEILSERA